MRKLSLKKFGPESWVGKSLNPNFFIDFLAEMDHSKKNFLFFFFFGPPTPPFFLKAVGHCFRKIHDVPWSTDALSTGADTVEIWLRYWLRTTDLLTRVGAGYAYASKKIHGHKTSQVLLMLSSVTLNCQVTKIVMNSGSQLSEF